MKNQVEVFLGMNVEKFIANTKKATRGINAFTDKLKQNRDKLKRVQMGAAIGMGVALLAIKKVTDAYGVQELAERKLESAMKNVKTARAGDVELLKAQAAALQQLTGYGDEQVINAQAMLATFQLNGDAISKITPRLLDMAAGLQKATGETADLQQLAALMGKALTGQTGALTRYGVVLSETSVKTGDVNSILKDLDMNFKGMAAGSLNTFTGQKKLLANTIGDLNEKIGAALIPTLMTLMKTIKPMIEKTTVWVDENRKLVGILTGVGLGGMGLLAGLSSLGFMVSYLPALFAAVLSPLGLATIAFVGLVGALNYFEHRGKQIPKNIEDIDIALENNRKAMGPLREELARMTAKYGENFAAREGLPLALEQERKRYIDLTVQMKEHTDRVGELVAAKKRLADQVEQERIAAELAEKLKSAGETPEIKADIQGQAFDEGNVALKELRRNMAGYAGDTNEAMIHMTAFLNAHKDIADESVTMGESMRADQEAIRQSAQMTAATLVNTFGAAFDATFAKEQRFIRAFGGAFVKMIIQILKAWINAKIAEVLAEGIAQKAQAVIKAPLSLGASLLAIAPILGAMAAGQAALMMIESKLTKQKWFYRGGIVPETGSVMAHKQEIIFNPETNTMDQFWGWLGQVKPSMATAGGTNYIMPNFSGPLNTRIDIIEATRAMAREWNRAKYREVD